MKFIDVTELIPDVVVDMRYTTMRNVYRKPISDLHKALLLAPAATALSGAANELRTHGLRVVIWDATRKSQTQQLLREYLDDERYVSIRSRHTLGLAVDMTVIDSNNELLNMGTDFDEFSERSWPDCPGLSKEVSKNRALLRDVMHKYHFLQLPTEWWHFDFVKTEDAEISGGIEDCV